MIFFCALSAALIATLGGCTEVSRSLPIMVPPRTATTSAIPVPLSAQMRASMPAQTPAPVPVLPREKAVLSAANALFSGVQLPAAGSGSAARRAVVIDPLIDGATGVQSAATQSIQSQIIALVQEKYPQFEVQELTTDNLAKAPLVLLGSVAGLNEEGQLVGVPEAYRIWLVLADLESGKIVAKGTARARVEGVDPTPTAFFRDSPAWTQDRFIEGYLQTCGAKVGDPIDPVYLDGVLSAALIADAIEAYDAGRYAEALDLYTSASLTAAGDQLRVHNGIYLANWKLGRRDAAAQAFARIVDYGLKNNRLAVMFLFKPGSTAFLPDPEITEPYPIWLEQIAQRTAQSTSCLEVTGHTSPTGPAALNERLSLLRAEFIRARLEAEAPQLDERIITDGVGSRANIVGTGRDDATDALDRRVEFKPFSC